MRPRPRRARRLLLIAALAYLLAGTVYAAASAWKDRHETRFAPGWGEPFASIVGILFWPWLLEADWKHKVGVFEPDPTARRATPSDG